MVGRCHGHVPSVLPRRQSDHPGRCRGARRHGRDLPSRESGWQGQATADRLIKSNLILFSKLCLKIQDKTVLYNQIFRHNSVGNPKADCCSWAYQLFNIIIWLGLMLAGAGQNRNGDTHYNDLIVIGVFKRVSIHTHDSLVLCNQYCNCPGNTSLAT